MPRGVYKRKKKTPKQRREIAKRAAATRKANREAAQAEQTTRNATRRKSKRFLSDDEKGKVVGYFFSSPGRTFANWGAVATDIEEQLGIRLSAKQAERLREAFSLPFDVAGHTEGEAVCEKRLQRIEQILAQIKASIDAWGNPD